MELFGIGLLGHASHKTVSGEQIAGSNLFLNTYEHMLNICFKSYLRTVIIPFKQAIWIEASFQFVGPCPFRPDHITFANSSLKLLIQ